MLASTAVLVSLLWALVGADQVIRFRRDDTACRSGATWPEEFACLRAQNSLGRIIANIEIDKDTRRESLICRNFDKLPDSWPDDYFEADPNDVNVVCTSPRSILIDAIESIAGLDLVSIKGQIEACPKTSPNYHYCLCKWHVNTQHLRFMAKFFYQNDLWADMDFSCEKYLKKVGRGNIPHETIEDVPPEVVDDMPQEADDGPPLLNQTTYPDEMSTIPLARRGLAFKIVGGYPLYSNGQYGLPLPYQDTYYLYDERDAVKRCWIHPQLPVIASCTAWYLTASRTATAVYQERYRSPGCDEYRTLSSRGLHTDLRLIDPRVIIAILHTNIDANANISIWGILYETFPRRF
ncbi:hypothetical protein EKO04_005407 [Ascochyta lentis]|uniref:Uncharacterized protein n=1 Tax=Ascochyta lentis TaxID=205686 RepID=A0A8H7MJZ7_9PLEO|nr:hypothetical protein EKO04_005407 [Ascochyta lentis]